ncbi:hypothetical protein R4Z10_08980 [Niallia sp. XMNu-256]|uniref:hypothetical protein n=1 Tax=Niallia sp. XMNu-256 TaxID=3082444 RepID=UPI0030CFCE83
MENKYDIIGGEGVVYLLAEQVETIANEIINDINPHKLKKLSDLVGVQEFEQAVLISFFKEYLKQVVQIIELDDITVENKQEVISFLNDIDNLSITNQIRVVQDKSKKLFKNPKFRLAFRNDYEAGTKILSFLIKSDGTLEENIASLHALDQYTEYDSNFIVDLDHT